MPTDTILIDGAKADMHPPTEEKRQEKKKGCTARERVLQENPYLSKMTPTKLTPVKEESEKLVVLFLGGTSAISCTACTIQFFSN